MVTYVFPVSHNKTYENDGLSRDVSSAAKSHRPHRPNAIFTPADIPYPPPPPLPHPPSLEPPLICGVAAAAPRPVPPPSRPLRFHGGLLTAERKYQRAFKEELGTDGHNVVGFMACLSLLHLLSGCGSGVCVCVCVCGPLAAGLMLWRLSRRLCSPLEVKRVARARERGLPGCEGR